MMAKPKTLEKLKASGYRPRSVKEEMRESLLGGLDGEGPLFPGIVGYDETVIPQISNALLSKHNMILLGLRGQAKSRILRSLVNLLDEEIPIIEGCEIPCDPFKPIGAEAHEILRSKGGKTPIRWLPRDQRYVEKLATPDVTIADIIGDIDPIKAAKEGLLLGDELTMHFGLLPRANRGIFAINELPDLAGKIQVGLFNIMQEGDIQIRGYPVRLPLDVVLVFTANPEDYTARGKIITPLKDRIGSEIRTHYPATVDDGISITAQEAWLERWDGKRPLDVPRFLQEVIEEIAFIARAHRHIDKQSGVSQRMPITCMENVISNAERRALLHREKRIVPRPSDLYSALPAITGKIELEYEGERMGAENVAVELIKGAIGKVFREYIYSHDECAQIVDWFDSGNALEIPIGAQTKDCLKALKRVPGLLGRTAYLQLKGNRAELQVAGAELILEGLHAMRKLSRDEAAGATQFKSGL